MIKADVAVIGAGPGGSVAAQRLAEKGLKIVLLEWKKVPWVKTCGDLVTREGLKALEHGGLNEWADQFSPVKKLRFTSPDEQVLDVPLIGEPIARIIPRRQLDERLVQSAVAAGVELFDDTRVRSVKINNSDASVSADGVSVKAQMVILADGSHAPITRSLGLFRDQVDLIAVRQYLAGEVDPEGPLEFHFQAHVIPGYTWMFPMGNGQINIGAGTYFRRARRREINLREIVEEFKAHHPLSAGRLANAEPMGPIRGHPLHTCLGGTQTHADRVLVVGDAAGLVGPFTGEGISAAMCSGEWAASWAQDALEAGDCSSKRLAPYSRLLEQRYHKDQRAARSLRSTLKVPGFLNRYFRNLRQDEKLANLFALVYLDERSPRLLLKPKNILRSML
jgi:menaquinone-9 beta-reductase